jgi:hypothetical protein
VVWCGVVWCVCGVVWCGVHARAFCDDGSLVLANNSSQKQQSDETAS